MYIRKIAGIFIPGDRNLVKHYFTTEYLKELFSIGLLCLLIFHYVGYYFIHVSLKHHNELAWQLKVEKDEFHPDQLQTISMSITFPYQPDQTEYQPVDKSIQLDRKFYRVIKQKYARDTLHLVYVNDPSSKRIHSAFENWVNQLTQNDNAANENQSVLKALYKQYYHHNDWYWSLQSPLCHQNHVTFFLHNFEQIYQRVPVPPPKHQFV